MFRKIINPSSKILCKLKLCVCDNGTYAGDSLNCSYSCSSSVNIEHIEPDFTRTKDSQ